MTDNFAQLKETVDPGVFTQWQEVAVEVYTFNELGINVAINDEYIGLVYKNQVYESYQKGDKLQAYIKGIRKDGRIDVSFHPRKGKHVVSAVEKILEYLKDSGGKCRFNDKSSSKDIKYEFQISKKVFNRVIGNLYKKGKINISDEGIELVK
jgi:uncharacterized protein